MPKPTVSSKAKQLQSVAKKQPVNAKTLKDGRKSVGSLHEVQQSKTEDSDPFLNKSQINQMDSSGLQQDQNQNIIIEGDIHALNYIDQINQDEDLTPP